MKDGIAQRDGRTEVMCQYEYWGMKRRVLAPPAFPVVVLPGTALGTKLVAAHDFGANIAREVARAIVVKSVRSTGISPIDPVRGRASPVEEITGIRVTE